MSQPRNDEQPPSRYVVGIDLGTTNCALAYVDTENTPLQVEAFSIPQLIAPRELQSRDTLPSFHYQALPQEIESKDLQLPWSDTTNDFAVGTFAREEGVAKPGRQIGSAKSWLCHDGVDRSANLLPWQGDADVTRLSPVEVASRYLQHLHDAWNTAHPSHPLAEQDVVITLPASFDEVARELTVAAAKRAGLPRVFLIEEPQAAFYSWVDQHHTNWDQLVAPGQTILVCDIGGGTSDFTLIRVRRSEEGIQFHRVAVGDHLILGGDNLDLTLATHLESQLGGREAISTQQWDSLLRSSRRLKETCLSEEPPDKLTLRLPGQGAGVIAGGTEVAVDTNVVRELLIDGFLPEVELSASPAKGQSGFREFGLPYAADPAITRYLASFLTTHAHTGDEGRQVDHHPARPDIVLLNGGFFSSPVLKQRLLHVVSRWFSSENQSWSPIVLENPELYLAVAKGAAYYGIVRRGEGVRIVANLARSYYIGVDANEQSKRQAVCLVPGTATAGDDFAIDTVTFELTLASPVEFHLLVSSTRLADSPGSTISFDPEQLSPLPPIRTVLSGRSKGNEEKIVVQLHSHLTEFGAIELSCHEVNGPRRWQLQFDVRSATQTDREGHLSDAESEGFIDETTIDACRQALRDVFGDEAKMKPGKLMAALSDILEMPRQAWPTSTLRRIWDMLMDLESGRRQSQPHEARWLNLIGFALRPGYGFAVDDWRVSETWRTVRGRLAYPASQQDTYILFRRISGGVGTRTTTRNCATSGRRAPRGTWGGYIIISAGGLAPHRFA